MRETEVSDPELLAGWLDHRREAAFHAPVARYAGLVHATARRTCGDDSLAAEATQLTFILLARKAGLLAQCSSLAGWLHRAAILQTRNLIRQTHRENRKRQQLAMETPSHSNDEAWREIQPVLDDALAALSEKDREALLLRFYRSLTIREIAATYRQHNHDTLAATSPTLGEALKATVKDAPHPARFLLEGPK